MSFIKLKSAFAAGQISKPEFIAQALEHHRTLFDYLAVVQSTDVKEIRIAAEGVSFVMGEFDIVLYTPPEEARVAPLEVMNFDVYERNETAVMDILCDGAGAIFDIGANIGWFSVRFAKRTPQAAIYAFEPLPHTFSFLQRNVAVNNVGDRVTTFNYGMSDQSGAVDFFISPTAGTNASLKNVAAAENAKKVTGLTLTLDQWVANQGVAPDFIKCDVEGAELLVFRGGSYTIAQYRPVVFAELLRKWSKPFGYHPNDVLAFFKGNGYRCFAIGAHAVSPISEVTEETVETNYAFLHHEKHAALIARLEKRL